MYEGMFKNNKMCGEGFYLFSSQGVYQGSFENCEWMGVEGTVGRWQKNGWNDDTTQQGQRFKHSQIETSPGGMNRCCFWVLLVEIWVIWLFSELTKLMITSSFIIICLKDAAIDLLVILHRPRCSTDHRKQFHCSCTTLFTPKQLSMHFARTFSSSNNFGLQLTRVKFRLRVT